MSTQKNGDGERFFHVEVWDAIPGRLALFGAAAPLDTSNLTLETPPIGFVSHIWSHRCPPPGPNWVRFARLCPPRTGPACRLGRIGFVSHVFTLRRPGLPSALGELGSFCIFCSQGTRRGWNGGIMEYWKDEAHRRFKVRRHFRLLQLAPLYNCLLQFGFLDVSVIRSFHHNKTVLDARLLTQKAKIPQKFSLLDRRVAEGKNQGQRATVGANNHSPPPIVNC